MAKSTSVEDELVAAIREQARSQERIADAIRMLCGVVVDLGATLVEVNRNRSQPDVNRRRERGSAKVRQQEPEVAVSETDQRYAQRILSKIGATPVAALARRRR